MKISLTRGYLHVTFGFVSDTVVAAHFLQSFILTLFATHGHRQANRGLARGAHLYWKTSAHRQTLNIEDALLMSFTFYVVARPLDFRRGGDIVVTLLWRGTVFAIGRGSFGHKIFVGHPTY